MTSTAYKFDGGQSYATHSFPAGTERRRRRDGAGHWLVAHREAQDRVYRNARRRIKETFTREENRADGTLDGPLLLQLHCVSDPSELCSVNISDRKLTSVKSDDFKVFENVAYIDASINALSLGSFSTFKSLRELNLAVNGICNMTFDAAEFPHLEVLDLSYNRVSGDDVVSLGRLPRLKVLHLSANQLRRLPSNLSPSHHEPPQLPEEDNSPFRSLEVLMLDDNKLSSDVFNSLMNLKRLKYLNLKGNCISDIPLVQLMSSLRPASLSDEDGKEGPAHREADPDTDEYFRLMLRIFQQDNWEERCREDAQPLPELRVLNLAQNKITKEEVLMAAALFPMLRDIDIQSNPLVTKRRGEPPLLMYLQERLGITIKCKKTADVPKLPMKVSTRPTWKVDQRVPKVSKKSELINATCPAHSQAAKSDSPSERPAGSKGNNNNKCLSVFISQGADVAEFDVSSEDKETAENKRRNTNHPEQFTDFKTLMDAKPNPDGSKHIGISTASWTPQHTLNNLSVYSKPELDSIQTPNRKKEKRIQEPVKRPSERAGEMMKAFRQSTSVKVVPLGSAMHSTSSDRDQYKEALSLLRDMKTKYKMLHRKAMEEVASFASDNTNQEQAEPPPNSHKSA